MSAYLVLRTPVGAWLGVGGPPCTLRTGEATLDWSGAQAMTATTVAGVGTRIGASTNGVAAAVGRSLSSLGDEVDSLTPTAARAVYRALPDVATPSEGELAVARALLGERGSALTCAVPLAAPDLPREEPGPFGLTPRADTVRAELRAVFGRQSLGGFAPEGVSSGHIDGSAHYAGRALDVFFRPVSEAGRRAGWQRALWAVAHAERLQLATVIFDREIWTARRSVEGWRAYRHPSGDTDNPILLHEDHVHLDVVEGG